jgi:hypothetical protein
MLWVHSCDSVDDATVTLHQAADVGADGDAALGEDSAL